MCEGGGVGVRGEECGCDRGEGVSVRGRGWV